MSRINIYYLIFFFSPEVKGIVYLVAEHLTLECFFFQGLFSRLDSMYALLIYALSSLLACKT